MADVLNPDALHQALNSLEGWAGDLEGIHKTWTLADFAESIRLVNRVADVAEKAGHHPDITVRWNQVTLTLVTHSAGGVTQRDLETAELLENQLEGF